MYDNDGILPEYDSLYIPTRSHAHGDYSALSTCQESYLCVYIWSYVMKMYVLYYENIWSYVLCIYIYMYTMLLLNIYAAL